MAQQEAEAIAASATYKHPTIDAEEWRNEMAHLRVKAESLAKQPLSMRTIHTHECTVQALSLSTATPSQSTQASQCKHAHPLSLTSHFCVPVCRSRAPPSRSATRE